MTVIVYRNGVMAADTGTDGNCGNHRWGEKIVRTEDGTLYGGSGWYAPISEYLRWIRNGKDGVEPIPRAENEHGDNFSIMRVAPGGPIEILTSGGWEVYDAPYFAMGSGVHTALGAMFAGADAVLAVRAAMEHGDSVWGDVHAARHDTAGIKIMNGLPNSAMPMTALPTAESA